MHNRKQTLVRCEAERTPHLAFREQFTKRTLRFIKTLHLYLSREAPLTEVKEQGVSHIPRA